MNYLKIIKAFLVISLINGSMLDAQEHIYPLKPGTSDWKNLSVEEKNKMLQIPEDKLKSMSTENLIQAYVDNPFCSLLFAYNTVQDGFARIYHEFNGLRELPKRPDIAKKIVKFYQAMQVDGYDKNWEPRKKGAFTFKFVYMEVLISQNEIVNQLSQADSKVLVSELIKKYNKKVECVSEHSIVGLESCAYAIAHILKQTDILHKTEYQSNVNFQSFLKTGHISNLNMLDQILRNAKEFTQN